MKKIIVCVLGLLMLAGCGKPDKTAAPVTENIKFNLSITYYNENYQCTGQLDGNGALSFTINEPEELAGMTLNLSGDSVRVSYKGLTYTPAGDSLPLPNVCRTVYETVKAIREADTAPEADGENYSLSGKIDGKEYIFTFSPAGYPLDLKLPSDAFTAEFSDVTLINNK